MSLFKQLFIAVCLLMLMSFIGSFLISVESSRDQQVSQLRAHAQDTATALALSLGPYARDTAMIELMVSSIFDSGYFESIRVVEPDTGALVVERTGAPVAQTTPDWFARMIDLAPARADAIVSDGWQQAARVEVISHPLFALGKLWQSALGTLLWLALTSVLCMLLGALFLRRQLRPLDYMVAQSNAISRREFLSLPELPRTPEFRRVVAAMNQMVEKLKGLFAEEAARSERLRDEAYKDPLTGLANRRQFDQQLRSRLSAEDQAASGYLLLARIHDLAGLNQRLGGRRTDSLIIAVAEQLQQLAQGRYLLARTRGGEFALLGAGLQHDEAEQLALQLEQRMQPLYQTEASDCSTVMHIGITAFSPGDSSQELYQALDCALSDAMAASAGPCWAFHEQAPGMPLADQAHYWHELLDSALKQNRVALFFQPVVAADGTARVLHHKVLARLPDGEGQLLAAAHFLPWVERLGLMAQLDLLMMGNVLQHIKEHRQPLALSISGTLLQDPAARESLCRLLKRSSDLTRYVTLELDESELPEQSAVEQLVLRLGELGVGLGLQHFGGRFSMIGNLAHLGLGYLKVDGSYLRSIDEESDKRLFIEALLRAAHSIDLPVLAERVETAGEWRVLSEMGVAGGQGRFLGEPAAWS